MELNRAMTDVEFRDMFRMYRLPFDALMERIRPFMQKSDEKQSIRGCGGVVTLEMKLCMTLRWLAGWRKVLGHLSTLCSQQEQLL